VDTYKTPENALRRIVSNVNMASRIYERMFNIRLALLKVDLHTRCDMTNGLPWNRDCDESYDMNQRLTDFSAWRGSVGNDGAALWHLMTRCRCDVYT
jgi:hypothetical protein